MAERYQDDHSIPNEANLWRRVHPRYFVNDKNMGRVRPSSKAFTNDRDGHPMSTIWEQLHLESGLTEADALKGLTGFAIAVFTAELARRLKQGLHADPDVEGPGGPAHVLVFGDKPKDPVGNTFAAESRWLSEPMSGLIPSAR